MTFLMSQKELDRYQLIQRCIRQELTESKTAEILTLSIRHVQRLKHGVRERGPAALIHGSRGKRGNRRIPDHERQRIVSLLRERYHDFGPTFAGEKLTELHHIERDPKTIRQIMMAEKLWKPRQCRAGSEHRSWRQRKDCYGELIQFDGSYEHWFEDRDGSGEVCLLAAIDDATGQLVKAQFAAHEGLFPVLAFWREYTTSQGKPCAIYLDKFSTYRTPTKYLAENHELKTQFQRALEELTIEPIFANSPQAKGRVERLFGTLQDRLIKELRLAGISTITTANQFLADIFIPRFNQRFAVLPRHQTNLHRSLTKLEKNNLNHIFSRHEARTVHNDFTIAFKKQWYQLTEQTTVTVCKRDVVTVEEWLDGSFHIRLRGKDINYHLLPLRPKPQGIQPWVLAATAPKRHLRPLRIPALSHPWRRRIHTNIQAHQLIKLGHF